MTRARTLLNLAQVHQHGCNPLPSAVDVDGIAEKVLVWFIVLSNLHRASAGTVRLRARLHSSRARTLYCSTEMASWFSSAQRHARTAPI